MSTELRSAWELATGLLGWALLLALGAGGWVVLIGILKFGWGVLVATWGIV